MRRERCEGLGAYSVEVEARCDGGVVADGVRGEEEGRSYSWGRHCVVCEWWCCGIAFTDGVVRSFGL